MDAITDWPRPAKAVAIAAAMMLALALWSVVASVVFLWEIGRGHPGVPVFDWWNYHAAYPDPRLAASINARVVRALHISAAIATAIPAALGLATAASIFAPRIAHDNARWASWRDMRKAGFSATIGLYLGRVRGRFVRLGDGKQRKHIAIYAPTQSGKGVGFVIPAGLCDARERVSFVFFDPKFEAFLRTSGWQAEIGAKVILFAPLNPSGQTAQYNPCAYVRRQPDGRPTVDTWGDIEDIVHAQILLIDGPQGFWNRKARTAYSAVLAFLSETPGAAFTIPEAVRLLTREGGDVHVRRTVEAALAAGRPYSAPCVQNLAEFVSGNPELRDGINKTITSYLGIFSNPRVAAALSGNTFDIARMMKERTALYVGVAPPDIAKLQPVITLLFQQILDLNTRTPPGVDPAVEYELTMVLDEFTLMGAMPKVADAFGHAAGYGIRLMPVFQTPAQLEELYKAAGRKKILDNCKIEIVLGGITDNALAREISGRIGTTRGVRRGQSSSGGGGLLGMMQGGSSMSSMERALMTPYEVEQLPDDEAIILHGGKRAILAKRIRYYDMAPFKRRLRDPVPVDAIEIDLSYDDGSTLRRSPEPSAPQAKKPPAPKSGRHVAPSFTVSEAEDVLHSATGGKIDLAAFAQSPAVARAQVDRVVQHLQTKAPRP